MQARIVKPQELSDAELALWRKWQRDDERLASPFLAPEYAVTYGKHFDNARVAVITEGAEIVGFFPYELLKGKVARALAFDLSDVQALICAAGTTIDFQWLLEQMGVAVYEFDHFVSHQVPAMGAKRVVLEPAPALDLSNGYDEWLASRRKASSSRMKKALQKSRKLEREVGPITFVFDSTSPEDLAQLIDWKAEQYVRTGRHDRFSDADFRGFVEDLMKIRTDDFQMQLSRMEAGGKVVALYLSLKANNRLGGWFPTYNPEFAAWSPGMACMLELAKAAAAEGLVCLELGEGAADYKESFKSFDFEVAEGEVARPVVAATIRHIQTAPKRAAIDFVLSHERVRLGARSALKGVGKLRVAVASVSAIAKNPPVG